MQRDTARDNLQPPKACLQPLIVCRFLCEPTQGLLALCRLHPQPIFQIFHLRQLPPQNNFDFFYLQRFLVHICGCGPQLGLGLIPASSHLRQLECERIAFRQSIGQLCGLGGLLVRQRDVSGWATSGEELRWAGVDAGRPIPSYVDGRLR